MKAFAEKAVSDLQVQNREDMINIEELYALYKRCSGISTDTRTIKEGSMFFALKGEKFDGNDYALDALKAGARYAVVDRVTLEGETVRGGKCIVVENVLTALQKLAHFHRMQFDIPVLAITGTNGKTTTKELVSVVLSSVYKVVATSGNFNNYIGVPLTLLRISEETQVAVVEMGASAPGEIAFLSNIVSPTCGLVTNVGKAHLLGFGSFEGVKKTKGELYDFLRQSGGTVFFNADNPHLASMVESRKGLIARRYGVKYQNAEVGVPSIENPFLTVSVDMEDTKVEISTKLVGSYNADNVMAALAVGAFFKVPVKKAVTAIENYVPSNNRSQYVRTENNVVIIDAYNANPTSMAAALENFRTIDFENKALILGDMLELGESSVDEHVAILNAARSITGRIYLVGEQFRLASESAGVASAVHCFPTSEALSRHLEANPLNGCTILVKGSNGTHLQGIAAVL